MRVLVAYRAIPQSPGWATGESVIRALRRIGHDAQPYAKEYHTSRTFRPPDGFKPDLLVYCECNDPEPQYVELLDLDCPRVYWEFDTSMHREWTESWATAGWSRIFLANPNEIRGALSGASYLPYAVDDDLFGGEAPAWRMVACIGHRFPERVEFCEQAGVALETGIYNEAYARALAGLGISVHHHDSGGEGLLVGRIWESLGSGCCLLTPDSPAIRRHFRPGVHLMVYSGAEDCRNKVRRLIERPIQREKISRLGRQKVTREHLYIHRVQQMLREVFE